MEMMMKAQHNRQCYSGEDILMSAHIGSVRHNAKLEDSDSLQDFETNVLAKTEDPKLAAAAKQLSAEKFFDLVQQTQLDKMSKALLQLNDSLLLNPAPVQFLALCLRQIVSAHSLTVSGLSESQRSGIRAALSARLAESGRTLGQICDSALAALQRGLATRMVDSHGDVAAASDLELTSLTLTLCQNCTDEACATGGDNLAVAIATEASAGLRLCREALTSWSGDHLAGRLHCVVEGLLRQCISVPYNMYYKQLPKVNAALAEHNFVQCAKPYLRSPVEGVRLSAYLLLIFACTEGQAASLLAETRLVELLTNRLRLALEARDRRCEGFHCLELAKCALRMARNDANKEQLVDAGLLTLLTDMLSSGRRDQQSVAMETLLCLSFSPACAPRIREQCRPGVNAARSAGCFTESLEVLEYNLSGQEAETALTTWSRCLATRGDVDALEQDEDETALVDASVQREAPSCKAGTSGHVMISYHQATSSDLADWLKEQLLAEGFPVWLDKDEMQGSTLECMARGVESARAVIVCLSRGYKDSNSCRMEAEYASRRGKPLLPLQCEPRYAPDGWLGLLVGSSLTLDFVSRETWELGWRRLARHLTRLLGSIATTSTSSTDDCHGNSEEDSDETSSDPEPAPNSSPADSGGAHAEAFADWSAERVSDWLRVEGLSPHLEPHRLAGQHLAFLLQLKREAPDAFYRVLETQLRLGNFHELYGFVRALTALESKG